MFKDATLQPEFGHPLINYARRLTKERSRINQRKEMRELSQLDDHLLDDIGLTRSDVDAVLALPKNLDTGRELRRLSQQRLLVARGAGL